MLILHLYSHVTQSCVQTKELQTTVQEFLIPLSLEKTSVSLGILFFIHHLKRQICWFSGLKGIAGAH